MNAMMSRFSSGVMFASLNTGIDCGPVSMASYRCVGVVSSAAGANLPWDRAPPAPTALWHIAQLVRKIAHAVGDVAERGVDLLRRRDGGAGAERGDERRELR